MQVNTNKCNELLDQLNEYFNLKYKTSLNNDNYRFCIEIDNNFVQLLIRDNTYLRNCIISFNFLNHTNCDMEIIQSISLTDSFTIYNSKRNENGIHLSYDYRNPKRTNLDSYDCSLILKNLLKSVSNKNCFFTFQNNQLDPTLKKYGFNSLVKYKNYNHGGKEDRTIWLIDIHDSSSYNLTKEIEKLKSVVKTEGEPVKPKRKYTRRKALAVT